ncbi:uncharacterized protein SPPG_01817 [Spizellomyces punctatus DAOM BR117]|uniref:Uncharacterized protein n=1 Tax=Spizellomyces punctatus (strain DAOM BR117) TaxID=645134 RepID=A0A0L0HP45_SPIPD|nr:uncharacterized protein SPPG_01817 [Spizellomyces punctatus DAOM BR117]KND02735.1 hypothetical protein SPPG_01817 [Spizellomyces punctatus DAOM BR117]|eukprot:XP_016610774.1 hypothetical protein SPPG_01817 [Spizellomyces punctatus DAOM BR117]
MRKGPKGGCHGPLVDSNHVLLFGFGLELVEECDTRTVTSPSTDEIGGNKMGAQSSKAARRFPPRPTSGASPSTPTPTPTATPSAAPPHMNLGPHQPLHANQATTASTETKEDPREEHKRLLEHYQQMAFDVHSIPKREYRKDNELLNILAKRDQNTVQDQRPPSAQTLPGTLRRLPTRDIADLFALRRMAGPAAWPPSKLAEKYGLDEKIVDILLRYYNTHETVGMAGGSERMDGIWVEDLVEFRKREAKGKGGL